MKNVIGTATASTVAATTQTEAEKVNGLRNLILDLLQYSPVITGKEWATAVERTSNTESTATLAKWYRNTVREIANREQATPAPVEYATGDQKKQIIKLLNNPAVTRRHKTRVLVGINRLTSADADAEIIRLTAYTGKPFGGGPVPGKGGSFSYVQAA